MNKLFDFLFQPDSPEFNDSAAARQELSALGVDLPRVEDEIANIVAQADRALRLSWLSKAQVQRKILEERAQVATQRLWQDYRSTNDLLSAVMAGKLGAPVQQHATTFFRNKKSDEINDADVRSFLEDCELLKLL